MRDFSRWPLLTVEQDRISLKVTTFNVGAGSDQKHGPRTRTKPGSDQKIGPKNWTKPGLDQEIGPKNWTKKIGPKNWTTFKVATSNGGAGWDQSESGHF